MKKNSLLYKFWFLLLAAILSAGVFLGCSGDSDSEEETYEPYVPTYSDSFKNHTFYGYKDLKTGDEDLPEGWEAGKYDTMNIKFGSNNDVSVTIYNVEYDKDENITYPNTVYTGTYTFDEKTATATITIIGEDENGTTQTKTVTTSKYTYSESYFTVSDFSELADAFSTTVHKRITGEPNAITITYNANFVAEGADEAETISKDVAFDADNQITVEESLFTREGYTFKGWATYASSSYVTYKGGAKTTYITENTTLYAVWVPNSFTITYNANFVASGATEAETVTQTVDTATDFDSYGYLTLRTNTFTRGDDYIFLGWGSSASSTYVTYKDGASTYAITKDTTLYALWLAKSEATKITFNANDDTTSPKTKIQYVQSGEYVTLEENVFTRDGYAFKGWATANNATEKEYSDKESYFKTSSDITLYAVWKDTAHATITFDANGGTGTMESQVVDTGKTVNLKANTFTKSGYVFYGWNTYASTSYISYVDEDEITLTDDKKLYAVWISSSSYSSVKVTYNSNDGNYKTKTQYLKYASSTYSSDSYNNRLSPNTFARENYEFKGWATSSDASYVTYKDKASLTWTKMTTPLNLYAVWNFTGDCTITFNANDGSTTPETTTQTITGGNSEKLAKNTFAREGYTFFGWATSKTATEEDYEDEASFKPNTTEVTLYAVWKQNKTITFNGNGGTASGGEATATQTVPYGTKSTLDLNSFTKANSIFAGWATTAAATKGTYEDGDEVTLTEDLTLYAIWITPLDVTLDPNGGSGSTIMDSTKYSVSDGHMYTFPEVTAYTKSGYELAGWATTATATSATYKTGDTVNISANTTFYAVWIETTRISVTISSQSVSTQTDISLSYKPATHSLDATLSGGSECMWLIDGESLEDFTGTSLNIYTLSEGVHTVTVVSITESGSMKSATVTVKVSKN